MMKYKLALILLFIALAPFCLFTQNYYYSKDSKVSIKTSSNRNFYLTFDNKPAVEDTDAKLNKFEIIINPYRDKRNKSVYWTIGGSSLNKDKWDYISPAIVMPDGSELNFSHLFYVKLKDKNDILLLEKMSSENNVEILGNNNFMPLWYTLACTKNSSGNALEMANLFSESKLFFTTEVDFLVNASFDCVNDNLFPYQFNLKNTGQNNGTVGMDINYCPAIQYTKGSSNLIIAIVDAGVRTFHQELNSSILYNHIYNVHLKRQSYTMYGKHGTQVAGIIFADHNNYKLAGIAPDCQLMQINFKGNDSTVPIALNLLQDLSDGINYAWQNGASIINNSWTIKNTAVTSHAMFDDAINDALTQGRNGKGCVIVFASGNNLPTGKLTVNYPANSNPDIITVGSISNTGIISYFSNYGTALDIVAPGENIYTTDSADAPWDHACLSGTSLAAPHVSGVAALILSVNPALTQKQVADIIEQTAQKVGGYNYAGTSGRANGTWNNEMGYGLVNAYEAVRMAAGTLCPSITLTGQNPELPETYKRVICREINIRNATVPANTILEVKATQGQTTINDFIVEEGAVFVVE